jgi:hypothetical protein
MHVFTLGLFDDGHANPVRVVVKNDQVIVEMQKLDMLEAPSWHRVQFDVADAAIHLLVLFLADRRPSVVHGPDGIYRTRIGEIRCGEDRKFEYILPT